MLDVGLIIFINYIRPWEAQPATMSKRPSHHLYLTMGGTHPTSMLERPTQHLHLSMGRTHPTSMSKNHAQNLHLTMGGTHLASMSKRHAQHSHLTMGGTHPRTMLERSSTHIRSWEEHIQEPYRKGSIFISNHGRNTSSNHVGKARHLYLTMGGTQPRTMSESLSTYIYPCGEYIPHPF